MSTPGLTAGTLVRPTKNGSTNQYVTENTLGYDVVQAPELDADFNVVYDYVNAIDLSGGIPPGGVGTAQLADLSVTTPKLADGAVTDAKVTSVDYSKLLNAPDLSGYLLTAGGTMTGPLTLAADPAGALQAATKQYVDSLVALHPPTTVGPSAPASPIDGQLWWRNTDGNLYIYYDDGTTAQFVPAMASVGKLTAGQYYLLAGSIIGIPGSAISAGSYVAALGFVLPANLNGSQGVAKAAATAQTDYTIKVNGVTKGTMRWAAGATVATFVWTAAVTVQSGDRVEIISPATPDATHSDPTWTLKGNV